MPDPVSTIEVAPTIENRQIPICPNPVFVVGSPRSGTSILPWALAQHSSFWTSRESDLLYHLYGKHYPDEAGAHLEAVFSRTRDRPEGTWFADQRVAYEELLSYLGLGLNALYTSRSRPKRWVEQSPVNTVMLDVLADMFPGAYFLHILRDGRRVVHSMLHFENRLTPELKEAMIRQGAFPDWARGAKQATRTWKFFVGLARDFQARNPHRCLTVVNEEISADPVRGFHEVFSFLNAAYEDGPAAYFRSHRINSSFEGRAAPAADAWNEWPQADRAAFMADGAALMVELGFATYDELDQWSVPVKGGAH
jgi:hypothetical protein